MAHKDGQHFFFDQPGHKYVALLRKEMACTDENRTAHTGLDILRQKGLHERGSVRRHSAASIAVYDCILRTLST